MKKTWGVSSSKTNNALSRENEIGGGYPMEKMRRRCPSRQEEAEQRGLTEAEGPAEKKDPKEKLLRENYLLAQGTNEMIRTEEKRK